MRTPSSLDFYHEGVVAYRFVARPRWLVGHVLVVAAVIAMVLLGHWQLTVSDRKGFSLQNFGYALQWWAFSIAAIAFWLKILHDHAAGRNPFESADEPAPSASQPAEPAAPVAEPVAYRRYVPPSAPAIDDAEIARYNAYLAALASDPDER